MTIKHLRELIDALIAEGVNENEEIYAECYRCNETDEILVATHKDGDRLVYISDSEPDDLISSLTEDGYTIKELY